MISMLNVFIACHVGLNSSITNYNNTFYSDTPGNENTCECLFIKRHKID